MKNNILPLEGTTSRKTLLGLNEIFKNGYQRDPNAKPPTPTDVTRVKVQSKDPTIFPRVQIHSKYTTIFLRVKPMAATPSPQPTLQQSKRICNVSKPIISHNANTTINILALE